MINLYLFFFFCLSFSVIVDPGGNLLGLKEFFFFLTFISGLVLVKRIPSVIMVIYIFIGLLFPVYGLLLGCIVGEYFSIEYGMMYLKAFLFISLILVSFEYGMSIGRIFSITSLLIIPITLILWCLVGEFSEMASKTYPRDIVVISRRSFGPLLIDPCIFYKTSPLLLFGLSYLCSKKQNILTGVLLVAGFLAMFVSGTRANLFSVVLLYIYFFWVRLKKHAGLKRLFIIGIFLFGILLLPYLMNEVFFNDNEPSLDTKTQLIDSYIQYWNNNTLLFLFGSGLGSGIPTDVRGIEYLLEPTYFELIRFWGVILAPVTFSFLLFVPFFFFYMSHKSSAFVNGKYLFVAYLLYVFIEIPSNPLLMSSTGMIVYVVALSSSFQIYQNKSKLKYSSIYD